MIHNRVVISKRFASAGKLARETTRNIRKIPYIGINWVRTFSLETILTARLSFLWPRTLVSTRPYAAFRSVITNNLRSCCALDCVYIYNTVLNSTAIACFFCRFCGRN
ncbi:hypothetical protein ACS0PU_011461 [Formica fusca]